MRKISRFRLEVQTDSFDLLDLLNRLMRLSPMIPEKKYERREANQEPHFTPQLRLISDFSSYRNRMGAKNGRAVNAH